jgi:hypothetical protein
MLSEHEENIMTKLTDTQLIVLARASCLQRCRLRLDVEGALGATESPEADGASSQQRSLAL